MNRIFKTTSFFPKTASLLGMIALASATSQAAVMTFALDNVFTDRGGQMTGQFTWTYMTGDFENGIGEFTSLDVPHTTHGLEDLIITIEPSQIEFSLDGSFHDDGVDITLVLLEDFFLTGSAALNLEHLESKYSIGGNGFIDGDFISGAISPVPEPSSALLATAGFCLLVFRRKRE